ncbi:hypothetical protein QQF64_030175 [Cirrhinus molitorella]|uniref:Uncharacterized protein n=2 Tax=Cirrhinus molitorella TaxID=172907 RepID=A0ABR3N2P0_9TELE|nr:hypothetical protein Q8A67_002401 [Cirrhinus molitorella]
MSSVFQALLGLTAAKDRRESSSEGRGGGVWLAARLTTPQQGCERPVSEHSLIYQWNATAAAASGLLKGSSTKRKRERHRESERLDRAAYSETERERERKQKVREVEQGASEGG